MKRRRIVSGLLVLVLAAGVSAVLVGKQVGCQQAPRLTGEIEQGRDRSRQLFALAAAEVAVIDDFDARLTQLLNLADQQNQYQWRTDAAATLGHAQKSLMDVEPTLANVHARLAGWVSVSELARYAHAPKLADQALDQAVDVLMAIDAQAVRCQYVMGLANELQYVRSPEAAAKLLTQAGAWTKAIEPVAERRHAQVAFASSLFNLDDYAGGQTVLRNDADPQWRANTLLALATPVPNRSYGRLASDAAPRVEMRSARQANAPLASSTAELESRDQDQSPQMLREQQNYGKQIKYRDVFQGRQKSDTQSAPSQSTGRTNAGATDAPPQE